MKWFSRKKTEPSQPLVSSDGKSMDKNTARITRAMIANLNDPVNRSAEANIDCQPGN
jgi:hypothetical protein